VTPKRHTQTSVEKHARTLLDSAGVTSPPVPIDQLAAEAGAVIRRQPNSPDISGLLFRESSQIIIGVNADDAPARQRFTIAHELGHLFLHKSDRLFVDRSYRSTVQSPERSVDPTEEREANWFAAELLMPLDMVKAVADDVLAQRAMTDDALIKTLAEQFQVSRQAMGWRLLNLGVVNGL
jgi:Zn-dependent peptidase ImmA (M78 family)